MIVLVIADSKEFRTSHVEAILAQATDSDVLVHDDTVGTFVDLEQYLYPSLFSVAPPIIHAKFILATEGVDISTVYLKKLVASPTVFIFEDFALPTPLVTAFKKAGAIVHTEGKEKKIKEGPDVFASAAAIISAPDKKSRWMAYRRALETSAIEAIIGIMYWKVRDMASRGNKEKNLELYKQLLTAHARAWETGTPLELMIEKVLLTH